MVRSLEHRGPDFSRWSSKPFKEGKIFYGHNRLSIVDLSSASHQPLENDRYTLLYNGELYNTPKNYSSDTQFLFNAISEKGVNVSLDGMYAWVWIDFQQEEIHTGRDGAGIKPLFIFEDDNYLILGSETQAIFTSGLVPKRIDAEEVKHYLRYKYPSSGRTLFQGVNKIYQTGVTNVVTKQIHPRFKLRNRTEKPNRQKLEELLVSAVEKQLVADVPVGLFLSGGIDSTLLLAISKELGHQIPTYSIGTDTKSMGTEDLVYAKKAAKLYGTAHQELLVDSSILEDFKEFINPDESIVGDSASLFTNLIARKASQEVKVVLTGAGADELFAGYNRHKAFDFYLRRRSFPYQLGKYLPDGFNHPLRKQFRLLKKLAHNVKRSPSDTYRNFVGSNWALEISSNESIENLEQALNYDFSRYLPDDILALTDYQTMQYGLEARVPFLDQPLVEYMLSIESSELLKGGPKWLLKELLASRRGEAFINRSKEGFGIPFGHWIREEKWQHLYSFSKDPEHPLFAYLPYREFQTKLNKHLSQRGDYGPELWSAIQLAMWLEQQ